MASFRAIQLRLGRDDAVEGEDGSVALSSASRRILGFLRRHWLILLFLVAGVGLRVVVTLAYWPALELNGDSYDYLGTAQTLRPSSWHPAVYPLFLRALTPAGNLGAVTITQHVLGLGLGVLLYVLLLRLGVRPWLAALGALPVLVDAFQLEIEQYVLAETLTDVLLVGGIAFLFWRRRLTAPFAFAAGLLLATVTVTRDATLLIVIVAGVYMLVRRWWRATLAYSVAAIAVFLAYGFWYASVWGTFGIQSSTGYYLYGRVASFASCDYPLTAEEAKLCPKQPVSQRPYDQDYYVWLAGSPLNQAGLGSQQQRSALAEKFSEQVVLHQPLAYLKVVAQDTWHYFAPGRWVGKNGDVMDFVRWNFPGPHLDPYTGAKVNGDLYPRNIFFANVGFDGKKVTDRLDPALMAPLRAYQRFGYTEGPVLLAGLVGGLVVGLMLLRSRTRRRHARWAALVMALSGLALALTPSLTTGFSYRYQLPLLVVLPPALVLSADIAGDALGRMRDRRRHVEVRHSGDGRGDLVGVATSTAGTDGFGDGIS